MTLLPTTALLLASVRTQIADYLSTLITVYTILIVIYILTNLLFSFGLRPPYTRAGDAILTFLRDVCEPFLRLFRRFVPQLGPIDLSPVVAILVLELFNGLIVQGAIHG
jgi:YggT family protein